MTITRGIGDVYYRVYGDTHDDFIEWISIVYQFCDPFQYYPKSNKKEENLVNDRPSQKV